MNLDVYNVLFYSVFIWVFNFNDIISVVLCNSEIWCKIEYFKKRVIGEKIKIKSKKYGGIYKNIVVVLIVEDDWDI